MSQLTEDVYNVKELYVVKFKESKVSNVDYFNTDLYYIIEVLPIESKESGFHEYYTECVVGRYFLERQVRDKNMNDENLNFPDIFTEIHPIPREYLNDKEMQGKISTSRIFQIFLQINSNQLLNQNQEKEKTLQFLRK